jgi:hypothetical protein
VTVINDDPHMPRPEPIWVALSILIWALAETLGPTRRARLLGAMARYCEADELRRRVTALHLRNGRRRAVSQSAQVACAWITRIVVELGAERR